MSKIFRAIPAIHSDIANPSSDDSYREVLNLLPTLRDEIISAIDAKAVSDSGIPIRLSDLPKNSGIASVEDIKERMDDLYVALEALTAFTDDKPPIVLVRDGCFTNELLAKAFEKILWGPGYDRFVDDYRIDFNGQTDDEEMKRRIPENRIVVLGGSFSDTYTIPGETYSSHLATIVRKNVTGGGEHAPENRFLGICYGQQFFGVCTGLEHIDSPNVIANIMGAAQFCPSSCRINDLKFDNPVVRNVFAGLSDSGANRRVSAAFTRSGHVDFDLLSSRRELPVIAAMVDEMTGDVVGWGTRNGRIIGVQFHPEISFFEDCDYVTENLSPFIPAMTKTYGKSIGEILGNYDQGLFAGHFDRDISDAFYVYALAALAEDLLLSLRKKQSEDAVPNVLPPPEYPEAVTRLVERINKRVFSLIELHERDRSFSQENRLSMLHNIDQAGKLEFVRHLDWKVNRGVEEYSDILGFKDLTELILKQKDHLKTAGMEAPLVFCDFGAGNGTYLEDQYGKLSGKDVVLFGVADRIYFDLYQGLTNSEALSDIPDQLKMLFVQKVAHAYEENPDLTMVEKLASVLDQIEFTLTDRIELSSMFTNRTFMFSGEQVIPLSMASRRFMRENPDVLDRMRNMLKNDTYEFFHGFFERIYLSHFHDFEIGDDFLGKEHFRVAVRSTSHVDSADYRRAASRFVTEHSDAGGVFLDNGVHRSYSSIPRLKELYEISQSLRWKVRISLVYDGSREMDYFSCAIIEKAPFHDASFWVQELANGRQIVSIESAYHCTFLRLECFVRNFLLSNFKNYDVFWNYNKKIVSFLQNSKRLLETGRFEEIKEGLVELIETIVREFDSSGHRFAPVDSQVLEKYVSKDGVGINDVLKKPISNPNWLRSPMQNR